MVTRRNKQKEGTMGADEKRRSYLKSLDILKWLIPFFWVKKSDIHVRVLFALFFTALMIMFNVGIPYMFKTILDKLAIPQQTSMGLITLILVLYGIVWTLGQMITFIRSILLFSSLERGIRMLSLRVFDHLLSLSLDFHVQRKTGAVTNAIARAQYAFDTIFWGLLVFIIPTILEMILIISVLTYFYGFFYSGIILIISLIFLSFSIFAIERLSGVQAKYNEKRSLANARIVDSLLNYETVKYSANENYEYQQCNRLLKDVENAGIARYFSDAFVQIGQHLVVGMGLIILTLLTGRAVITEQLRVSDFVLINGYLMQFIAPLTHFGYILRQVRQSLNDMEEVKEITSLKPDIKDAPDAVNLHVTTASIIFNNVYFGYDAQRPLLKNISFTVPVGKTLAIVGPSGSGKTTIARLLFRLYDVNRGSIFINDYDVRSVTQQSLRAAIGIVPQDAVLFNDTLFYNIAYAKPNATQKDVESAAHFAHLDEFIQKLPDGYDTLVGERGLKLSGGEKQRVAIARVILKKPAIYIFDEATSSLDTTTEREIQKNLEELSSGSTTIIVAHRLSTVIKADEIIVLDNGFIVEHGTHNDLLKFNGLYARLWNKQQTLKNIIE